MSGMFSAAASATNRPASSTGVLGLRPICVDAGGLEPERGHLAEEIGSRLEARHGVVERPVRRPRVEVEGSGRSGRLVDGGAATGVTAPAVVLVVVDKGRGAERDDGSESESGQQPPSAPARPTCRRVVVVRRRRRGRRDRRGPQQRAEFVDVDADERRDHDPPGCLVDGDVVAHGDDDTAGRAGGRGPGRRVLDRHAVARVDPEGLGGLEVGLGMGLTALHRVAGDDGLERVGRKTLEHGVDEAGPRHRHQGARHALLVERAEQLQRARPPRRTDPDPGDHVVEETFDDGLRLEVHAATRTQHGRSVEKVEADHRAGVVVGPRAAELVDERVLGRHPVRLGVDQGAVHVPEDGGGGRGDRSHRWRTHSWTSSISVPKLALGWKKATVVPRLPGRGAASIGTAPAAFIASYAVAQSATR